MIDKLFDFDKAYSAGVILEQKYIPSVISFPNSKIQLTLTVMDGIKQSHFLENTLLLGFVSTKKGTWFFSSNIFFQTEFSYDRETYLLNEFIICNEKYFYKDLQLVAINLNYDNLIKLDNFIVIEKKDKEMIIEENFEEIIFNVNDVWTIKLINQYNWSFRNFREEYFVLKKSPFIEIRKNDAINFEEIQKLTNSFSHFLQLIFDIPQSITNVEIVAVNPKINERNLNLYYYHSKLIENKSNDRRITQFPPVYQLADLVDETESLYKCWLKLLVEKNTLVRLFFNEINSSNHILDDRFKNLCSIIQGLDRYAFCTRNDKGIKKKRGDSQMFKVLKTSFDESFRSTLGEIVNFDFLDKLLSIIGEMRDFFQHLNKEIGVDLSLHSESMYCVNSLLKINIRYHLLKLIGLSELKINLLIKADLRKIDMHLLNLRKKLIEGKDFFP